MKTFGFYGVCGNAYKLNDKIWEALEDPSDGYRSYLDSIISREDSGNFTFSRFPIATVRVEAAEDIGGWRFYDVDDNHLWLEIGTDNREDWYPTFIFNYYPKLGEWERFIEE